MWRCSTTVFLPLARVIGADPAKAFKPRASAKRVRSSPPAARRAVLSKVVERREKRRHHLAADPSGQTPGHRDR